MFEQGLRLARKKAGLSMRALGEQMISPVRAAQLLRLPLATIEREIRGPHGQ